MFWFSYASPAATDSLLASIPETMGSSSPWPTAPSEGRSSHRVIRQGLSGSTPLSALSSPSIIMRLLLQVLWPPTLAFCLSLSWIQNRNIRRKTLSIHHESKIQPFPPSNEKWNMTITAQMWSDSHPLYCIFQCSYYWNIWIYNIKLLRCFQSKFCSNAQINQTFCPFEDSNIQVLDMIVGGCLTHVMLME